MIAGIGFRRKRGEVIKLKDRVAIAIGGGMGIGRAISLALAHEGAKVMVTARNPSRLEEVAEEIKSREVEQRRYSPTSLTRRRWSRWWPRL